MKFKLTTLTLGDNIDPFFNYLDRPFWFKMYLKSYFETQRLNMHGTIFLAIDTQHPDSPEVGCVYCELQPNHLSYGKNVPIFGWVQAKSEEVLKFLFTHLEHHVKDHGFDELRGPINPPKLFGGWGAMIKGFDKPLLIDSAKNDPNLATWIENAGYKMETEYVSLEVVEPLKVQNPFPNKNIELISLPITELGERKTLMNQLKDFVMKHFVGNLPDSSFAEKKHDEIFQILSMVPNGENYYLIAYDHDDEKIIGLMIEIPNIYQQWMGKPISTTNVNTVIIGKEFRNQKFFHWLYLKIYTKLVKIGIKTHVGGTVWIKNIPALTSFAKISKEVARFAVFQKKL